jgi:hypothetical protein
LSTMSSRRQRASLALGTALALTAASLTIGISPVSAAETTPAPDDGGWATVTDHAPHSSTNNKVVTWCGRNAEGQPNGYKLDGKDISVPFKLLDAFQRVVVKTGANQDGNAANTVFGPGPTPTAGQWVWADTDGDGDPEIGTEDKDSISHIIFCYGGSAPDLTTLEIVKEWDVPEGYPTPGIEFRGSLTVTVDGDEITEPTPTWSTPIQQLPVKSTATVEEKGVPTPPQIEGFQCVTDGPPQYRINSSKEWVTGPVEFPLLDLEGGNTVTVLNTVTCAKAAQPITSLQVIKRWTGVPAGNADPAPGALSVEVNETSTDQTWNDVKKGLPVGAEAVVSETKPTLPTFTGYTCSLSDPSYIVNGAEASNTAVFDLQASDNKVTVVNALDCTALIIPPPTASLTVTKAWLYVGVTPPATNPTPGALTVTVGGAATGQAWGATTSGHAIGANATVTEGFVTPPQLAGYTCTLAPSYVVNGGPATSTAPSFALVALNTVTVTNTVTCDSLPVVDDVEDEVVIEDVSDEDTTEESAVAGSEDELAATGGSTSAALLGALLVLSGAALIGARRRFGMTD